MSPVKDTSVSYVNVLYKRGNLNCFFSNQVLFIIYSDDLDGNNIFSVRRRICLKVKNTRMIGQ